MTARELQREADRDLVERFLKGMIPYPILLIILAFTTDYPQKHPYIYGSATILVIVTSLVRIALQVIGDRVFVIPHRCFWAFWPWSPLGRRERQVSFTPARSGFTGWRTGPSQSRCCLRWAAPPGPPFPLRRISACCRFISGPCWVRRFAWAW